MILFYQGWEDASEIVQQGKLPGGNYWNYYPDTLSSLSSHCNSFEDRVPVDLIYGYPIFKWVALTWFKDRVPG